MERPESWDALTGRLASSDLDDENATLEGLSCAGLVVPLGPVEREAIASLVRVERAKDDRERSKAVRIAAGIHRARLSSIAATIPDPAGRRGAREWAAFTVGARLRACAACGLLSTEWWQLGRCRCGAPRVIPRGDDTVQSCLACEGVGPVGAKACESCGRPFAPPVLGPQTRLQVLDGREVLAEHVVARARFTIGRDPDNDVVLPWPNVARRHVRVIVEDTGWSIEDLGSPGGTLIDGRVVRGRTTLPADPVFDLPPLKVRLSRPPPPSVTCEAIADESERWLPTFVAVDVQRYTARLCDGLELAVGPSFLEAQTLLPATEALLRVLRESPLDVVLGGLGGAIRARLLFAVRATVAAAVAPFDEYDAFKRLSTLDELAERLPQSMPPMTPPQVIERIESEVSEWEREASLALESWHHMSTDDYAVWQGNQRWLSSLLTDLRAPPRSALGSTREALDAVERLASAAPADPTVPPPQRSRAMLADSLVRLRALLRA